MIYRLNKCVQIRPSIHDNWSLIIPLWRHQMETITALVAICAGNSPVNGEFPAQRPVTRSYDVFFDLRLNKPLSKQSWGWWFETPSRPLWRHCNALRQHIYLIQLKMQMIHRMYTIDLAWTKAWDDTLRNRSCFSRISYDFGMLINKR